MKINTFDCVSPKGSILDGLDDWPRSATRKEWFRITRELVASTIADMDLPPNELAQVEESFHQLASAKAFRTLRHSDVR